MKKMTCGSIVGILEQSQLQASLPEGDKERLGKVKTTLEGALKVTRKEFPIQEVCEQLKGVSALGMDLLDSALSQASNKSGNHQSRRANAFLEQFRKIRQPTQETMPVGLAPSGTSRARATGPQQRQDAKDLQQLIKSIDSIYNGPPYSPAHLRPARHEKLVEPLFTIADAICEESIPCCRGCFKGSADGNKTLTSTDIGMAVPEEDEEGYFSGMKAMNEQPATDFRFLIADLSFEKTRYRPHTNNGVVSAPEADVPQVAGRMAAVGPSIESEPNTAATPAQLRADAQLNKLSSAVVAAEAVFELMWPPQGGPKKAGQAGGADADTFALPSSDPRGRSKPEIVDVVNYLRKRVEFHRNAEIGAPQKLAQVEDILNRLVSKMRKDARFCDHI